MRIQIAKSTPLAWAPDAVCQAINRWTPHEAFISNDPAEFADVIHFNNTFWQTDVPAVIQYHSEPGWKGLQLDCHYPKMVNAQYHMLLPEYADCVPVRQVINFCDPEWDTLELPAPRIGYSPTSRVKVGEWHDKGYEQTVAAIKDSGYLYDIIEGVPPDECIRRKRLCNIIIDECITGSYHRSGLEGLALGQVTIGRVSYPIREYISNGIDRFGNFARLTRTPRPNLPIIDVDIDNLAAAIHPVAARAVLGEGIRNRLWMLQHWHPADVVKDYIDEYEEAIYAHRR